jgi:hypothetical protein
MKKNLNMYFRVVSSFLICASSLQAQYFNKIVVEAGLSNSNQIKTPVNFADGGSILGFVATVEPTIWSFGSKKQFDLNVNMSFIQKGGSNYSPILAYDPYGQSVGIGSETYAVTINYISFSPCFKANIWKILFVKAGPRCDVFTGFHKAELVPGNDPRSSKDFNATTCGLTYGIGLCTGKKRVKFVSEIVGQNDFTQSSYNKASNQTFKNYSYLVNLGILIDLKSDKQ